MPGAVGGLADRSGNAVGHCVQCILQFWLAGHPLVSSLTALCALQSEPRDYVCNALGARMSAASATTLTVGVLLTLVSVVYSAFRAGSNTQTFRCVADWGSLHCSLK